MNKLETIPEELVAPKPNGLARLLEAVAVEAPPAIRSGFASKFIAESIAILEQLDTTIVIAPDDRVARDPLGNLIVTVGLNLA